MSDGEFQISARPKRVQCQNPLAIVLQFDLISVARPVFLGFQYSQTIIYEKQQTSRPGHSLTRQICEYRCKSMYLIHSSSFALHTDCLPACNHKCDWLMLQTETRPSGPFSTDFALICRNCRHETKRDTH